MAKTSERYHWNNSPVIQDIIIEKCLGGKQNAILFAPENCADPKKLETLQVNLANDYGILSYVNTIDSKPVLIAKNIGDPQKFFEKLESGGLGVIAGAFQKEDIKDPDAKPPTLADRFDEFRHQHGIRLFAGLGMAGHLTALVFLGLPKSVTSKLGLPTGEENPVVLSNAALNIVNCCLYLWKGNGDRGLQADPVLEKLHDMFAENGIDLDKTPINEAVKLFEANKPLAKKMDQFIGDHIMWFTESIGLVNNVKTGIEATQSGSLGLAMLSLSAFLGSTAATIIPEVPVKDQPPERQETWHGKIISYIQANIFQLNVDSNMLGSLLLLGDTKQRYDMKYSPAAQKLAADNLATTQAQLQALKGSMGTNTDMASFGKNLQELAEKENAQQGILNLGSKGDVVWKAHAAMSALYVACNAAGMFASKNAPEDSDPLIKYEELFSRTAQTIQQQPDINERERMIDLAGIGLAAMHEKVRGVKPEEISDYIRQQVQAIDNNPFVAKTSPHQELSEPVKEAAVAHNNIVPYTSKSPSTAIDTAGGISHLLMEKPSAQIAIH